MLRLNDIERAITADSYMISFPLMASVGEDHVKSSISRIQIAHSLVTYEYAFHPSHTMLVIIESKIRNDSIKTVWQERDQGVWIIDLFICSNNTLVEESQFVKSSKKILEIGVAA